MPMTITATHRPVSRVEFTRWERDVIALAAQGLTYAQIGAELGLTAPQVKNLLGRLGRKVGGGKLAGLVMLACRLGLLDDVPTQAPPRAELPRRSLEVLVRIADGLTDRAIARELHLSEAGVRSRVKRLLRRAGARTRSHAVLVGWQQGWFPVEVERSADSAASLSTPVSAPACPSAALGAPSAGNEPPSPLAAPSWGRPVRRVVAVAR